MVSKNLVEALVLGWIVLCGAYNVRRLRTPFFAVMGILLFIAMNPLYTHPSGMWTISLLEVIAIFAIAGLALLAQATWAKPASNKYAALERTDFSKNAGANATERDG